MGSSETSRRGAARRGVVARSSAFLLVAAAALATPGCAGSQKYAYGVDELRAEIRRRAPELPPDAVVVPFDVDPATVEIARRATKPYSNREDQVRALVELMFSGAGYALSYAPVVTTTARETLATHKGNCLALASVFVGVARALGLKAYYLDASARLTETTQPSPGIVVNSGHITAYVDLDKIRWYLDFDHTLAGTNRFRVIDDLEATAHFYNNRGYERIEMARLEDKPVDWVAAEKDFTLATHVVPAFARAWNNLGIARTHVGDLEGAETAYREAIHADPKSPAAYNNLGGLLLRTGRAEDAVTMMREAVQLDPDSAYAHFNLGRALLATGDTDGARRALEKAARMRDVNAQRMLSKLDLYPAPVLSPRNAPAPKR